MSAAFWVFLGCVVGTAYCSVTYAMTGHPMALASTIVTGAMALFNGAMAANNR